MERQVRREVTDVVRPNHHASVVVIIVVRLFLLLLVEICPLV